MLLKKILASGYSFLNERNALSYYSCKTLLNGLNVNLTLQNHYKINAPSLKTKLTSSELSRLKLLRYNYVKYFNVKKDHCLHIEH